MENAREPQEIIEVSGGEIHRLVAPVARYTSFVAVGKRFLMLLAFVAVGVVVWVASDNTGEGGRIVFSGTPKGAVPLINEMIAPHYQGVDAKNQPYTVTAEKAVQKDAKTVALQKIRADMTQNDGTWLAMDAGSGEINTETSHLKLMDEVGLFYDGGYELRTSAMNVDVKAGNADSESAVEAQGPNGTIKAQSFSVLERGAIIRFNGSVITTLYP